MSRWTAPRRLAGLTAFVALVVTATLVLTTLGSAELNPATFTITLPAGTSGQETNKTINLPIVQKADVEIAIDTTASMNTGINDAIAEAGDIVNGVQALVPDTQFALVQFKDFGFTPEYRVEQPMTPSATVIENVLSTPGLFAPNGGGDAPEAYNLVFHNSYTDAAVGWRSDTRKFVVVIGDAQPHGQVKTDGFPDCANDGPDPHSLDTMTELTGMKNAQRTMLMILEDDNALSTNLQCYQELAAATFTGGGAVESNGTGLATDIVNLITSAIGTVQNVHLEVVNAGPAPADASWLTLPPALGPVAAPGTYPFGPIGISVPSTAPPGSYTFELKAVADGLDVPGHELITVNVPQPPPPSGLIICKSDANGAANETFDFTVTGLNTAKAKRAAPTAPIAVQGGACSDEIALPAGNYSVAEDITSGVWQVSGVATDPANALVGSSLPDGTATVSVPATGTTKVTFTNSKVPPPPPPGLVICKSGANGAANQPFSFTVTSGNTAKTKAARTKAARTKAAKTKAAPIAPITVDGGACSDPIALPAGNYTVGEDLSSGKWRVTGIAVDPTSALIGTPSLTAGTVKVSVPATGQTKVTFTNTKVISTVQVCKWSGTTSLQGKTYTFTVSGGSLPSAVTLTAKAGASARKPGCSTSLTVDPGSTLTVKETVPANQDVTITGGGSAKVTDLGDGKATVKIGPNGNKVIFEDELQAPPPPPGTYLLLCKNTSGGSDALPYGTIFHFTVDDGNPDHSGPYDVPVWGPPGDETHCVPVLVDPGKVKVTELGPQPNSQLVEKDGIFTRPTSALVAGSVNITPASDWRNPIAGSAQIVVPATATSTTQAPAIHFVDVAVPVQTAVVEICKKILDGSGHETTAFDNDPNAVFTYTIPGEPNPIRVHAGQCSRPTDGQPGDPPPVVLDRDGNFTVEETQLPDGFRFVYAKATGNSGQQTSNPVTFHKDAGSWETVVTFYNQPAPAAIKVCKKIDAGSTAALGSVAFTFDVYVAGVLVSEVKVKPGACSGLINVPGGVVGPNGTPAIEVTEQPYPGSKVTKIDVQNSAGGTFTASTAGGTVKFGPAPGVDIVTFTNTAT